MINAIKWLSLLIILTTSHMAFAEVYKWVDDSGRVHYGDKPSDGAKVTTIDGGKVTSYDSVAVKKRASEKSAKKRKVTMFSTSWCGYCKKARKYFTAKGIPFVEYDIEKNPKAKRVYDKIGGRGVPVIVVGKKKMTGFSPRGFDQFYGS